MTKPRIIAEKIRDVIASLSSPSFKPTIGQAENFFKMDARDVQIVPGVARFVSRTTTGVRFSMDFAIIVASRTVRDTEGNNPLSECADDTWAVFSALANRAHTQALDGVEEFSRQQLLPITAKTNNAGKPCGALITLAATWIE